MAKQTINQGTAPTGAGGDTFRSGSAKLQANDDEIYNYLGDGTNLNKLGTAAFKNTGTQAGNVMEVGAFGLGGTILAGDSPLSSLRGQSNRVLWQTTVLAISNAGDYPSGMPQSILNLSAGDSADHHIQLSLGADAQMYLRGVQWGSDIYTPWVSFRTSKNTATDSNGFIKAASPVIKLFANNIELNDEAKQQEISFEKLGIGDYLIKGSSGFAQEGWYIETPKYANGNVLFSVIYTTLKNGDISVKTYKKKFDFETVSIVADLDNPVYITENRWIDLRLQELPQPEIEMLESIAPPEFQPTGLAEAVATVMESYHDPEQ